MALSRKDLIEAIKKRCIDSKIRRFCDLDAFLSNLSELEEGQWLTVEPLTDEEMTEILQAIN